ncbi:MAG: hypothetical protein NPIRA06_18570 [Nitrospirales bacterium]|nr:MAG: hypothetical protein NPIRA06_18570 [Nitrospirales bacterium]
MVGIIPDHRTRPLNRELVPTSGTQTQEHGTPSAQQASHPLKKPTSWDSVR